MPKLTKQQTLEICIDMWTLIADSADDTGTTKLKKSEALHMLNLPQDLEKYIRSTESCAACAYAALQPIKERKELCSACPIWTTAEAPAALGSCCSLYSPYHLWTMTKQSMYARDIIKLAKTELDKLLKEKGESKDG